MSRYRLQQLNNLARNATSALTPALQFTQLQATPTLLRTRSRQWFGSTGNLANDFSEKPENLRRR